MSTGTITSPSRYDVVGSFLRPEALKKARADFEAGRIGAGELKEAEDAAIRDLVDKEKAAGLKTITDGEFRRATWHLDFMWGFEGVGHRPTETGLPFHGETAKIDDTYLTGRLSLAEHHPFIEHFRFVNSLTDERTAAKLTIPAPAQFLEQFTMPFAAEHSRQFYPDFDELIADIAAGYRSFIRQIYEAGCRTLQFDDCSWGLFVDPLAKRFFDTDDAGLERLKQQYLEINNLAIEGKPADLAINTHVCRGNFHSTWAAQGAYNDVAKFLFARENVDAFYLEFDDARSGGFEPLAEVAEGKTVVLGLVTTKSPKLEDRYAVKKRIFEAAEYLPLERLCLSPQCGFASCEIGNRLTEEEQWKKVALVREIAEDTWQDA
ncbi:5-methyltetrahydropteroyltriglutamate--homocysteine S-methyltransferase [Lachnoclostridium sp. Marseille-P6806]|uniref:5-methyltetrahydropteroyltriglutamate-- homocysteine S-methyltransferase n=1 Tax=Lachnoclostridium sp. Marseille-P6806 TaxID=2364793 RepID=UPI00102FA43E|nr:5-methyltetrahydropteroyltriglutamate--homocysteine S-methyltransferase [Lachnoclostridium sp. Marseille-P6806]